MDENDFRHGYGNYFKNSILKVTWYQLFSKFWTTTRHIDNGIWKTPYSWRFYGHGSSYVLILSWINMMKRKWAKIPWKLLAAQKFEPVLWRLLHQHISLIIIFFFLWNKPSFHIQSSGDRKTFSTTCLSFYLLIPCASWSSSGASKLF